MRPPGAHPLQVEPGGKTASLQKLLPPAHTFPGEFVGPAKFWNPLKPPGGRHDA
jgi:hypothetical protein